MFDNVIDTLFVHSVHCVAVALRVREALLDKGHESVNETERVCEGDELIVPVRCTPDAVFECVPLLREVIDPLRVVDGEMVVEWVTGYETNGEALVLTLIVAEVV